MGIVEKEEINNGNDSCHNILKSLPLFLAIY